MHGFSEDRFLPGTGAVIIPAFNEEMTITSVLSDIRRLSPELDIIVVNDASTDDTITALANSDLDYLDLPVNLGAWGAIQAGMRLALSRDYDFVVTMDADGQHLPETLAPMMGFALRAQSPRSGPLGLRPIVELI